MKRWLKQNGRSLGQTLTVLTLLFLSQFLKQLADAGGRSWLPLYQVDAFIYAGLVMYWGIRVRRRIIRQDIRRYLETVVGLLLFFLLVRTMKYGLFENMPGILRYLWYLYYVAILMVPVYSVFIAVMIGKAEGARLKRPYYLLFAGGVLLTLLILTNDLHQMAFRFHGPVWDDLDYSRGWLYYAAYGWSGSLTVISIVMMIRKNKYRRRRGSAWSPVLIALICMAWTSFVTGVPGIKHYGFQFTEILILTQILIYESCIRMQLIPSNRKYENYFMKSDVPAMILDEDGQVRYVSQRPVTIGREQRELARSQLVFLDETTLVQAKKISGGEVVWGYDVSAITGIMKTLREMKETLSERNELLKAENKLKEQQAKTEEMNRIYDKMLRSVSPALGKLEASLDRIESGEVPYREEIGRVAVIGAYIKRRCNLAIITDGAETIEAEELYLALDESMRYMKGAGAEAYLEKEASGRIRSSEAEAIYEAFEEAVETHMHNGAGFFVRIFRDGDTVRMRLLTEDEVLC